MEFVSSYQAEFYHFTHPWNVHVIGVTVVFLAFMAALYFFSPNIPKKIQAYISDADETTLSIIIFILVWIVFSVLNYVINGGLSSWLDALQHEYASKLFASGHVSEPYPPSLSLLGHMLFMIVRDGKMFIKYFPGWGMILALFRTIHPSLVAAAPPLMLAICATLIFKLGAHLFNRKIAIFAAAFSVVTPYTLVAERALFDYYPMLACAACVGGFFTFGLLYHENKKKSFLILSLCFLGTGLLVRPYDMVLAGPSLLIASLIIYRRFAWLDFLKHSYILIPFIAFQLAYIYKLTGSPFTNLYTLDINNDSLGFGNRFHGPYYFNDALMKYKKMLVSMLTWKALFSPYSLVLIAFSLLPGKHARASWAIFSLFAVSAFGYFFYYATHLWHMFGAIIYLSLLVVLGLSRVIELSLWPLKKFPRSRESMVPLLASYVLIALLLSVPKLPTIWGRSRLFNAPYLSVKRAGIKNSVILLKELPDIGYSWQKDTQLRGWHPKNAPFALQRNANVFGLYREDNLPRIMKTFYDKDVYLYEFDNENKTDRLSLIKRAMEKGPSAPNGQEN